MHFPFSIKLKAKPQGSSILLSLADRESVFTGPREAVRRESNKTWVVPRCGLPGVALNGV